jgi:nucleoside phosphorylase
MARIRAIVQSTAYPPTTILEAEDTSSARRHLAEEAFDLVIIDLTLPAVKDRSEVGYSPVEDLLLEVVAGDDYLVPGDILGITREPEALGKISLSIGPHLMAVVVEETNDDTWQSQLADRVAYVQKSELARLRSISSRYDYDVAIITALDEEMAPYSGIFDSQDVSHFSGARHFAFSDREGNPRRGVLFSVGGAGQAGCASAAQALIARFRPRAFFMSGFCGGYSKRTKKGEVIVFQSVYDWDTGKWTTPRKPRGHTGPKPAPYFQPRAKPVPISSGESERVARQICVPGHDTSYLDKEVLALSEGKVTKTQLTFAVAASGSAVIANVDILNQIRSQNDKIVAVDMESYGFYQACTKAPGAKPEMMCVKAVADFCNVRKNDDLHASASYAAAKVVEHIIRKKWRFE